MTARAWLKRSFVNSMVVSDRKGDVEFNPSGAVRPDGASDRLPDLVEMSSFGPFSASVC